MDLLDKWDAANDVQCGICKKPMDLLTKAHMRIQHGLTREEYLQLHPEHRDIKYWGDIPKSMGKNCVMMRDGILI